CRSFREPDIERYSATVSEQRQLNERPRPGIPKNQKKIVTALNRLPADRDNDVARPHTGAGGRAAGLHLRYERSLGIVAESELPHDARCDVLGVNPEPAP